MTMTPTPPALTPPHEPGGPAEPVSVPPAGRRPSSRVVAIIAVCAGAALLAGTVFTGILSIVRTALVRTDTLTASTAGLQRIDLDVSAADVTVGYGTVDEATLRVRGSGAEDWVLERDGDRLIVTSDRDWWGRWGWFREGDTVELVLPRGVEGVDADLDLSGGSLTARGGFGDLHLDLDAGTLRVSGSAVTLTTEVNAGSAEVDLSDVTEATLSLNAGSFEGSLRDRVPDVVLIDVNAGRLDLTVPDATYGLTTDVSAGGFSHDLSTAPGAGNRIDVRLSAGTVVLRAAD